MIEGDDFSSPILVTQGNVTTYPKIGGGGTQKPYFRGIVKLAQTRSL